MAQPFFIPTSVNKSSWCSTSSPVFGVFSVLDFGNSYRCVEVAPYCFNWQFPNDIWSIFSCTYLPSLYLLCWGVCSGVSPIFLTRLFSPARSTRKFFSDTPCKNLVKLLEAKLTKIWFSPVTGFPEVFNSQTVHTEVPAVHQLQLFFSTGIGSYRVFCLWLSVPSVILCIHLSISPNLGWESLPCDLTPEKGCWFFNCPLIRIQWQLPSSLCAVAETRNPVI